MSLDPNKPCIHGHTEGRNSRGTCRTCCRGTQARYHAKNRTNLAVQHAKTYRKKSAKYKAAARRNKYGISQEQFDALFLQQRGVCARPGCGRDISGLTTKGHTKACVDHCHTTGVVRGLLCFGCNSGIGLLGDTTEGLLGALEYLRSVELRIAAAGVTK